MEILNKGFDESDKIKSYETREKELIVYDEKMEEINKENEAEKSVYLFYFIKKRIFV